MTQKFNINDTIYIPSALLPNGSEYPTSIYRASVVDTQARSVKISLRSGQTSDWIASSKANKNIGIAIITIGDFSTEETLLNPLAKSVLQFSRLLLDDGSVAAIKIRSVEELKKWWQKNQLAYSHVVLIGHGSTKDLYFAVDDVVTPADLQSNIFTTGKGKKTFISLCCQTGSAPFAEEFSSLQVCENLIAPKNSIHGAIASQFFQNYMCQHLLEGRTTKVAFKKASATLHDKNDFNLWKSGSKVS